MHGEIYCAECGAEILTDEDLGATEEVAHVRANLVGIPSVGSTVRYETEHFCRECVSTAGGRG